MQLHMLSPPFPAHHLAVALHAAFRRWVVAVGTVEGSSPSSGDSAEDWKQMEAAVRDMLVAASNLLPVVAGEVWRPAPSWQRLLGQCVAGDRGGEEGGWVLMGEGIEGEGRGRRDWQSWGVNVCSYPLIYGTCFLSCSSHLRDMLSTKQQCLLYMLGSRMRLVVLMVWLPVPCSCR
jgi:hypothetical protein